MKRLKNRGHTSRETNSAPVTLMDIIAANEAGLLSMSELVPLLLCFYCGLRPKEVCKIACDYKSNIDSAITVSWDKKDLILNFSKTTVKSNLYKCVRARCVCAELIQEGISNMYCICSCKNKMRLFTCEADVYKISVRVFSHPSFEHYKKAVKILKDKEAWVVGREMSDDPKKSRVNPAHLIVAMNTTVNALGLQPILTRQQRDDWLNKLMSARTSYGDDEAYQIMGEVLRDLQDVNIEVAATNYQQRFQRWMQHEFDIKWRQVERRQAALQKERKEMQKLREEQEAAMRRELDRLAASQPYGKGGGKKGVDG
eukprot:g18032.t1